MQCAPTLWQNFGSQNPQLPCECLVSFYPEATSKMYLRCMTGTLCYNADRAQDDPTILTVAAVPGGQTMSTICPFCLDAGVQPPGEDSVDHVMCFCPALMASRQTLRIELAAALRKASSDNMPPTDADAIAAAALARRDFYAGQVSNHTQQLLNSSRRAHPWPSQERRQGSTHAAPSYKPGTLQQIILDHTVKINTRRTALVSTPPPPTPAIAPTNGPQPAPTAPATGPHQQAIALIPPTPPAGAFAPSHDFRVFQAATRQPGMRTTLQQTPFAFARPLAPQPARPPHIPPAPMLMPAAQPPLQPPLPPQGTHPLQPQPTAPAQRPCAQPGLRLTAGAVRAAVVVPVVPSSLSAQQQPPQPQRQSTTKRRYAHSQPPPSAKRPALAKQLQSPAAPPQATHNFAKRPRAQSQPIPHAPAKRPALRTARPAADQLLTPPAQPPLSPIQTPLRPQYPPSASPSTQHTHLARNTRPSPSPSADQRPTKRTKTGVG